MKKGIVYILLLISASFLYAQTQSTSTPGRIGKWADMQKKALKPSQMVCDIGVKDPSGDRVLSKGESAEITILVKNNHAEQSIQPQLTIETQASWENSPRTQVRNLSIIPSGKSATQILTMDWDERFPTGTMTYRAQVEDKASGTVSEWASASFSIAGKTEESETAQFVDVDRNIPGLPLNNQHAIAVVIGNQNYLNPDIPKVTYAIQDAKTVKNYLTKVMGYREENVFYMENASKTDLDLFFGTKDYYKGKLYNYVKPGRSDVFIYFSGHGAPGTDTKRAYIMPVNTDPNYIAINGYPLDVFYANLEKINAKSMTVVMDACFSGGSDQGMVIKNASPIFIEADILLPDEKINVLTSSAGDQISSWYPEGRHSLFTYYLLRGIRGEADRNGNRKITFKELKTYLEENVTYMARRLYGREQTPVIKGDPNSVFNVY